MQLAFRFLTRPRKMSARGLSVVSDLRRKCPVHCLEASLLTEKRISAASIGLNLHKQPESGSGRHIVSHVQTRSQLAKGTRPRIWNKEMFSVPCCVARLLIEFHLEVKTICFFFVSRIVICASMSTNATQQNLPSPRQLLGERHYKELDAIKTERLADNNAARFQSPIS